MKRLLTRLGCAILGHIWQPRTYKMHEVGRRVPVTLYWCRRCGRPQ